jgi:hypothetical protein
MDIGTPRCGHKVKLPTINGSQERPGKMNRHKGGRPVMRCRPTNGGSAETPLAAPIGLPRPRYPQGAIPSSLSEVTGEEGKGILICLGKAGRDPRCTVHQGRWAMKLKGFRIPGSRPPMSAYVAGRRNVGKRALGGNAAAVGRRQRLADRYQPVPNPTR